MRLGECGEKAPHAASPSSAAPDALIPAAGLPLGDAQPILIFTEEYFTTGQQIMHSNALANLAQTDLLRQVSALVERVMDRPWTTLIELLMIAAVVYAVLRMLQGTRGARLVRAVVSIVAVSFAVVWLIAERFGFDRINVLYPYFILGVFLVSLVAFQSELRRILARLGEGGWLQRWMKNEDNFIEPLVIAFERLASRRTGALVALERSTELGTWLESGVRLDAVVSTELLETLFCPSVPLHDLGVIVRQGRIAAAVCQFPLAESGAVQRSLGSRHRAAVGLSQETDAVVVIASEENGQISVAIGGQLRRNLTPSELRELLSRELAIDTVVEPGTELQPPVENPIARVHADGTSEVA
jgi:diadenylate cyclase